MNVPRTLTSTLLGLCLLAAPLVATSPYCDDVQAFTVQDLAECKLYEIDNNFNSIPICPDMLVGREINNIGFRSTDGLLYGIELVDVAIRPPQNLGLVTIDPENCTVSAPVRPAGLPELGRFDAGDITPDGRFLFANEVGIGTIYTIDLDTAPVYTTTGRAITHDAMCGATAGGKVHDWAYNPDDGLLYGGDNSDGEIAVLDPATGARVDWPVVGGLPITPPGNGYGGAWFEPGGALVVYLNDNLNDPPIDAADGEMWKIDITRAVDCSALPIIEPVFSPHTEVGGSRNDVARCQESCDLVFVMQDLDCLLHACDPSMTAPNSCVDICPSFDKEINNLAHRSSDGMLYGVELKQRPAGNKGIVRIDPATCGLVSLGSPPPAPGEPTALPTDKRFDAGDITPDGRTMFINWAGFSPLYKVDLETWQVFTVEFDGHKGLVHDWAYNPADGLLYGGDNDGQLAILDPGGGVRVDKSCTGLPSGVAYGGAWINAEGLLILHRNHQGTPGTPGELYQIDLAVSPCAAQGPVEERGSSRNDAAMCKL